jgi:NADPH:quinone reductase-like Zn-dependent oxidoreductase
MNFHHPLTGTMKAMVTLDEGGFEKLFYTQLPIPQPLAGEVLIRVHAAGMNNTEINTRLGWYGSQVDGGTEATSDATETSKKSQHKLNESISNQPSNKNPRTPEAGGWRGETPFPFIQGTDCCGTIVAFGTKDPLSLSDQELKVLHQSPDHLPGLKLNAPLPLDYAIRLGKTPEIQSDPGPGKTNLIIGQRVLIRPNIRVSGFDSLDAVWMGSDFNGAFAEFVRVPVSEVFPLESDWTDVDLASLPCAYGTAENLLIRAGVTKGQRILVTGASGGVGSAAVQLAKRRGAQVIAVAGKDKIPQVEALGTDRVIPRGANLLEALGDESVDGVIDTVGGEVPALALDLLTRGGSYATSGAIAGPIATIDLRQLYLKDLQLLGATGWHQDVFPNLISYVENNEIRPVIAKTYPLEQLAEGQREFLKKNHVGKFVVTIG